MHVKRLLCFSYLRDSKLAEKFSIEHPDFSLPQVLSNFELPTQMAELKESIDSDVSVESCRP